MKKFSAFAKANQGAEWTNTFNVAHMDGNHWEKYIETFKPHTKKDYPFILIIDPKDDKKYYSRLIGTQAVDEVAKGLMNEIIGAVEKPKNKDEL